MMYRHNIEPSSGRPRKVRRRKPLSGRLLIVVAVAVLFVVVAAVSRSHSDAARYAAALRDDDAVVEGKQRQDDAHRVYRRRIVRSEIPGLNYNNIAYRQLFNDSNYVQLSAARANGIDPSRVGDPAENSALVPIFSTAFYSVDTMYHSKPYLLPEAVLLLDYIAHRFDQLMDEHYPQIGRHKVIVTSALRTEQSEQRLRRVNRNATDTSCHIYGTTFDLSAQRYEHIASGRDTVVDACKQMLALALYELRYAMSTLARPTICSLRLRRVWRRRRVRPPILPSLQFHLAEKTKATEKTGSTAARSRLRQRGSLPPNRATL